MKVRNCKVVVRKVEIWENYKARGVSEKIVYFGKNGYGTKQNQMKNKGDFWIDEEF